MKNFLKLLSLKLLLLGNPTRASEEMYQLRHRRTTNDSQTSNRCTLFWKYERTEEAEQESLDCEIMHQGLLHRLPLLGLSNEWLNLHKDEIVSGESILVTAKLDVDGDLLAVHVRDTRNARDAQGSNSHTFLDDGQQQHQLIQPEHHERQKNDEDRRLVSRSKGRKRTVVVHIRAKDSASQFSPSELRNHVFGTHGTGDSISSQLKDCSYGQYNIVPSNARGVINGVYNMNLNNMRAKGKDQSFVTNAALKQLRKEYGSDLTKTFDHVMICVPEEMKKFIAYAWGNDFLTVFHGKWCKSFSANIHEIGHNMGLKHSGEGNCPVCDYADQSGMMGFVYPDSHGPKMCYNGAQSFQLGWYQSKAVTVNPLRKSLYSELVGTADHGKVKYYQRYKVIIKIDAPLQQVAFFVIFNRSTGINDGTMEGADQVLITSQEKKKGRPGVTNLVAKLDAGEQYEINNFDLSGESVFIRVDQILEQDDIGIPWSAVVAIDSSRAPLRRPTVSPTPSPTASPTQQPTKPPTTSPTDRPTKSPTTPSPKVSPVVSRTESSSTLALTRKNIHEQYLDAVIFPDTDSPLTSTPVDCKIFSNFQCSENTRHCKWDIKQNVCESKRNRGRDKNKERSSSPRDHNSASWD